MFQAPIALGSTTGIVAPTAAPTLPTDGYDLRDQRFAQLWIGVAGGTSAQVAVYLLGPSGWILYTDVPPTTFLTADGGGVLQIEPRGALRCYVRVLTLAGGETVAIHAQGVTY